MRVLAGVIVAVLTLPIAAHPAHAATAGICPVSGTATISPGLGLLPTGQSLTMSLSGTCIDAGGTNAVAVSVGSAGGAFTATCAGGAGALSGSVFFSTSPPPGVTVQGEGVMSAGTFTMVLTAAQFDAVLQTTWIACPLSSASASLTGVLSFVNA